MFRGGRWPEYGRSLIAGKTDVFDALDEVISQWMDAIRSGRVQRYIPEDMMPRDPRNGRVYTPDSFGADFIQLAQNTSEDAASKMEIVQPDIRYDAFLASYSATLDMCLQGILSPATLGIDIGKLSSGEAQRERKDITGFTRNSITAVLERVLPQLVTAILQIDDWIHRRPIGRYTPSVSFGEYASPDFASRAKAVREAAAGGAMSIEAQIEELWGGSKDDEWISAEIKRVKAERGITETDPPGAGDDLP